MKLSRFNGKLYDQKVDSYITGSLFNERKQEFIDNGYTFDGLGAIEQVDIRNNEIVFIYNKNKKLYYGTHFDIKGYMHRIMSGEDI